jgi:hypothetical protein
VGPGPRRSRRRRRRRRRREKEEEDDCEIGKLTTGLHASLFGPRTQLTGAHRRSAHTSSQRERERERGARGVYASETRNLLKYFSSHQPRTEVEQLTRARLSPSLFPSLAGRGDGLTRPSITHFFARALHEISPRVNCAFVAQRHASAALARAHCLFARMSLFARQRKGGLEVTRALWLIGWCVGSFVGARNEDRKFK